MPHRIGDCEFDLVCATTGAPLFSKLDSKRGDIWYCGEDGQEFFISITNKGIQGCIVHKLCVDGTGLHYRKRVKGGKTSKCGLINPDSSHSSMKFQDLSSATSTTPSGAASRVGTIEFLWSNYEKTDGVKGSKNRGLKSTLAAQQTNSGTKKSRVGALSTTAGSVQLAASAKSATTHSNLTHLLQTVKIRYCAEAGLVVRGIIIPGEIPHNPDPSPSGGDSKSAKRERATVAAPPSGVVDLTGSKRVKREYKKSTNGEIFDLTK
jgi:hypothetical protein